MVRTKTKRGRWIVKVGKRILSRHNKKPQVVYVKDRQTGVRKSIKKDRDRKAMPPGKRKSKSGKIYYEYRRNRTDKPKKKI